jgi:hypothetical protein
VIESARGKGLEEIVSWRTSLLAYMDLLKPLLVKGFSRCDMKYSGDKPFREIYNKMSHVKVQ